MAAHYGIRLDDSDPALAIVSLNQILLEQAIEEVCEQLRSRIAEFDVRGMKSRFWTLTIAGREISRSRALEMLFR